MKKESLSSDGQQKEQPPVTSNLSPQTSHFNLSLQTSHLKPLNHKKCLIIHMIMKL